MKHNKTPQPLRLLAIVFSICLPIVLAAGPVVVPQTLSLPALASSDSDQRGLYKLSYDDLSELRQALAFVGGADVLGVDLKGQFATLLALPTEAEALSRLGYRIELIERSPQQRLSAWSSQYYTYARMTTDLSDLATRFPSLATLNDLGPTWETTKGTASRRVWALRISANPAGKPQVLFVANEHAREIVTVEIAMRLAKYLLEGYGSDPEATFLVDNRDTWIVPMVNPDGHVRVEQGMAWKRKTANTDTGPCSEPYWGVDINRNFPFQWGLNSGSSPNPCDETYRGVSGGSEPETRAITSVIEANSFTFAMDYHSYSNLILWPWGYTYGSPGDPRLPALGEKLAELTGRSGSLPYTPEQGSFLYPTSGNLLDWAYAAKNVLPFTTEIGDSFDPDYSRVDTFWAENRPPALYLLNIADNASRVYGPEATGARTLPDSVGISGTVTLTAMISDSGSGGQTVAAAEYFLDSPGPNGTGIAMAAQDGAFDESSETVVAAIPAANIGVGRHTLFVRGADSGGNWGSLSMVFVRVIGLHRSYLPVMNK